MLQQTRLSVVDGKNYFTKFMSRFPTIAALAEADVSDVIKAWEGLGYYRRARMLHAAAQDIMKHYSGVFPNNLTDLLQLSGIGKYTAGAILSFAYNQPAVIVDGNIFRVISRLYNDSTPIDSTSGIKKTWQRAEQMLDRKMPRLYNSALMELGQQICKVGTPICTLCPVSSHCTAKYPELLPEKEKKISLTSVTERTLYIINQKNEILLTHDPSGRRKGLWQFPLITETHNRKLLCSTRYSITRYKVVLETYQGRREDYTLPGTWFPLQKLQSISISAPYKKVLEKLSTKYSPV